MILQAAGDRAILSIFGLRELQRGRVYVIMISSENSANGSCSLRMEWQLSLRGWLRPDAWRPISVNLKSRVRVLSVLLHRVRSNSPGGVL